MKKTLSALLVVAMAISMFAGCGNSEVPTDASTESTAAMSDPTEPETIPETTTQGIETDERLLTVEITLPAVLFEGDDMSDFDVDAYVSENGFLSAQLNENGSLTVKMSKAKHREMLADLKISMEDTFAEFVEAPDTPYIKEITHNDDFTTVEIKVVRSDYENAFDLTPFVISIGVAMYQAFLDMDYHVDITVVDVDTGDVISTANYPIEEPAE